MALWLLLVVTCADTFHSGGCAAACHACHSHCEHGASLAPVARAQHGLCIACTVCRTLHALSVVEPISDGPGSYTDTYLVAPAALEVAPQYDPLMSRGPPPLVPSC